jgi:uncharacterized phiE125 gp8 family phage protein
MAYSVVTPAASESDDDTLISALISAAREMCESYCRRILVTTVIDEYFDGFPNWKNVESKDIIYLSRGPVASIASVKYVDEIGSEVTVSSDAYVADLISEPARIASTAGWFATIYDKRDDRVKQLPTASEYLFNPFRIFTF